MEKIFSEDLIFYEKIYNFYLKKNKIPKWLLPGSVPITIAGRIIPFSFLYFKNHYISINIGKLCPETLIKIYQDAFNKYPTIEELLKISEDIQLILHKNDTRSKNKFKQKYGFNLKWELLSK